ncbi:MAG: Rieske (2Fe-2S) protein [Chloroflexi bacterium]|nr:Rieske (2Fe-2S) protein [Chloroflexota bacterium]
MSSSASRTRRHVVCRVDDLPPGSRREVPVGGENGVMVFNVGGRFYAMRNRCPHSGGPLGRGVIRPHVISNGVGHFEFEREAEILKCPFHNWEFDIATGCALYDPSMRAKTYPVAVEDGDVVLTLG